MKQDYIMRDLMKKPLPEMPADIRAQLDAGNVTLVPFAEKDRLIADDSLIYEVGYKRFPNGNYYCAMYCPRASTSPSRMRGRIRTSSASRNSRPSERTRTSPSRRSARSRCR